MTRPHSARFWRDRLLVDNSGYGELVSIEGEKPVVIARLPGWTRGLCVVGDIAFVGTSRVIRGSPGTRGALTRLPACAVSTRLT